MRREEGEFGYPDVGLASGDVLAPGRLHLTPRHVLLLRLDADVVRVLHGGDRDRRPRLSPPPHVPILDAPLRKEEQNFSRRLRPLHFGRAAERLHLHHGRLHLDHDGSLATDGRPRNGSVCGFHRVREIAQPQSVDVAPLGFASLRRLLGVLLAVHLQLECDGQSGDASRRQSRGRDGP